MERFWKVQRIFGRLASIHKSKTRSRQLVCFTNNDILMATWSLAKATVKNLKTDHLVMERKLQRVELKVKIPNTTIK